MDVFLSCKDLKPEEIKKLAESLHIRLISQPAMMQVSSLTNPEDTSEMMLWKVSPKTVKIQTVRIKKGESRDYAFDPKNEKIILGKVSIRRTVLRGQTYAIQIITLNLYYDKYDSDNCEGR